MFVYIFLTDSSVCSEYPSCYSCSVCSNYSDSTNNRHVRFRLMYSTGSSDCSSPNLRPGCSLTSSFPSAIHYRLAYIHLLPIRLSTLYFVDRRCGSAAIRTRSDCLSSRHCSSTSHALSCPFAAACSPASVVILRSECPRQ